MLVVQLACYAMRTRFELVLVGEDEHHLRAAGELALSEIVTMERLLSRFRPDSDIGRANALAARQPVRIDARTFNLLRRALQLSQETDGVFDITIAPLLRCWSIADKRSEPPMPEEVADAKSFVGASHVLLDEETMTVRFDRDGMMLDLGGIGKGYAIERATQLLQESGVENALLHGGTSTIYAFGHDPDGNAWQAAVAHPLNGEILTTVTLNGQALSVSVVRERGMGIKEREKAIEANSSLLPNPQSPALIIDPRTGYPVTQTLQAAIVLPSPTDAEAWSTALLVMGKEGVDDFCHRHPEGWAFVLDETGCPTMAGE